ncbi:MAG: S41 family peptidase [Candidatus Paceibacterota bacterium]|jgi:carboxyl-terminal processing protease
MENNFKLSKFVLVLGVILALVFGVGAYVGVRFSDSSIQKIVFVDNSKIDNTSSSTIDMTPFWEVWKDLETRFVPTVKSSKVINNQEKIWGAIQGLTTAYGDPYTIFMPPEDSTAFESDISGNFEGVGMEIGIKENSLIVVSPLKATPAYNAGIKSGDQILTIDGKSTEGISVDKAVKLIRGKAGTQVVLKIAREGKKDSFEVKITRGIINVPTLDTEIKGDVFVIKLYNFYAPAAGAFRSALREFIDSGKYKLTLDLRGNPGGYLESAVDMASWFLPMGKVVVSEDFGMKGGKIYRSKGYDVFTDQLKMVILVDGGSASASEILAGALQEHGVAKLVGAKTFGKGSVQELIKITPETSLKMTIAKWLTPNGNSISEKGITPDYEVKISDADAKAGVDSQFEKAVEVLSK